MEKCGGPTHSRRSNEWVGSETESGLAACEVMLAEPTHPKQRDEWGTRLTFFLSIEYTVIQN